MTEDGHTHAFDGRVDVALDTPDDLALVHELTTLAELRSLADPLRLLLFRLLRERERTVKELCDILGESSTRLYYHVAELERVGLVRLVRTEARSGIVQKYYRSIARFVAVPFSIFQAEPQSEEAQAAVEWYRVLMEQAFIDLRLAFFDRPQDTDPDTVFATRNYIRTTAERAKELVRKLVELQEEIVAADDPDGPERFAFTTVLAPTAFAHLPTEDQPPAEARLTPPHPPARRRRGRSKPA